MAIWVGGGVEMRLAVALGVEIAATNDVGDDGIVDARPAITKTMRIQFGSSGGKFEILFWSWFPASKRILWIQKIMRLWRMRVNSRADQTKLL